MRKLIPSIVLAIVILLALVQFGPPLLSGQQEGHAKSCHYRDDRSAAGPQGRIPAIVAGLIALVA